MKITYARGLLLALGLTCGTSAQVFAADPYGAPSLLPLPVAGDYGVQQTAGFKRFEAEEAGSSYGSARTEPVLTRADEPIHQAPPVVSPYEAANGGAWGNGGCTDGACGDNYGGGCDDCLSCCEPCTCWWVGSNFLWFGIDNEDFNQLSFDDTDLVGSVLNTDSATMPFSPGFEVFAGLRFGCGAIEARYWGIFTETREDTVLASQLVGNLNTVFDFQPLNIGATNVNDLYDAAQAHRVRRSYDFHNVEINWLEGYGYNSGGFDVSYLAGVRYFRFDEGFQYASADGSPVFGVDPANEAYYDIDVENHLLGVQLGATGSYLFGPKVRVRATPKVGVYNNHISHQQRIYNASGVAVVGPGNPLAGAAYDISSDKDDVSFLAEIDLGLDYRISHRWSLNVGYRAMAVTGVAFATTQIPRNFADIPGAQDIDNDESMILHGGYAGATFSW